MRRKKAMANLKGRVAALERRHLRDQPVYGVQFDRDALAIYDAMAYLDATMEPTYYDVEATAIYVRGEELRDARYGPIIPAHLDQHLQRYTRASGEFELAFGVLITNLLLWISSEIIACANCPRTVTW